MICRATLPDEVVSHQGGDDAIMMMTMMVMMIKMMVMMTCRIVEISDHFCGYHGFSITGQYCGRLLIGIMKTD